MSQQLTDLEWNTFTFCSLIYSVKRRCETITFLVRGSCSSNYFNHTIYTKSNYNCLNYTYRFFTESFYRIWFTQDPLIVHNSVFVDSYDLIHPHTNWIIILPEGIASREGLALAVRHFENGKNCQGLKLCWIEPILFIFITYFYIFSMKIFHPFGEFIAS